MAATKLVVDNGAYSIKIGFSNNETPRQASLDHLETLAFSLNVVSCQKMQRLLHFGFLIQNNSEQHIQGEKRETEGVYWGSD